MSMAGPHLVSGPRLRRNAEVDDEFWPMGTFRKKRKVYAVRRHDGSLCTQKQPETAALKAAIRKSDPKGGQPAQLGYKKLKCVMHAA